MRVAREFYELTFRLCDCSLKPTTLNQHQNLKQCWGCGGYQTPEKAQEFQVVMEIHRRRSCVDVCAHDNGWFCKFRIYIINVSNIHYIHESEELHVRQYEKLYHLQWYLHFAFTTIDEAVCHI
jgi:hypothetical protein